MATQAEVKTDEMLPAATSDKDLEHLVLLYAKTGGRAWEPPAPNYPWLVRMIAAGFLRRCTMRCGFEAFDSGVTWTDAGHLVMRNRAAQGIEAATAAETVKLGSVHESPVGNADAPKSEGNQRHAQ